MYYRATALDSLEHSLTSIGVPFSRNATIESENFKAKIDFLMPPGPAVDVERPSDGSFYFKKSQVLEILQTLYLRLKPKQLKADSSGVAQYIKELWLEQTGKKRMFQDPILVPSVNNHNHSIYDDPIIKDPRLINPFINGRRYHNGRKTYYYNAPIWLGFS